MILPFVVGYLITAQEKVLEVVIPLKSMEPVGRFNDRASKNGLKMPGPGPKATDPTKVGKNNTSLAE